jgi:hypothetical protein
MHLVKNDRLLRRSNSAGGLIEAGWDGFSSFNPDHIY